MNRDWTAQPEASGPLSESDLGQASYGQPGYPAIGRIDPPYIGPDPDGSDDGYRDPAPAAIDRCRAAERAADLFKSTPADALEIS
jgi:hypothetical protein